MADKQVKKECAQEDGQDISLETFVPEKLYINRGGKQVEINPTRLRHPHYALQGDKYWMNDPAADRSSPLLITGGHRSNPSKNAYNNAATGPSFKDAQTKSHPDTTEKSSTKSSGGEEQK